MISEQAGGAGWGGGGEGRRGGGGGGGISTTYVPKCFPQAIQDDHEESKFTRTSGSVITSTSAEKVAMSEVNKLVGSAEGFQLDAKERPGRR